MKRLALCMSGRLSGLVGVLFAVHQSFASPGLLYVAVSGEVVIITVVRGIGALYGSLVGA